MHRARFSSYSVGAVDVRWATNSTAACGLGLPSRVNPRAVLYIGTTAVTCASSTPSRWTTRCRSRPRVGSQW
eukprot:6593806-Prorocentrum_lima.AAC.1